MGQTPGIVTSIWQSFNAGELSPLLDGRTDQEKYFAGAKIMRNFMPTVAGPAVRRAGTRYIQSTKNNGAVQIVPFVFSTAQSYVLEFGDLYLRFWTQRGQLLSGPSPYEVVSPYGTADLINADGASNLRTAQSADTMYIALSNGAKPPVTLRRLGATNWTLTTNAFPNGPFLDVDPSNTIGVRASAATGTVTLTATASLFTANDIGTAFYIEAADRTIGSTIWQSETSYTVGDLIRYGGNVYQVTATTGAGGGAARATKTPIIPTHLQGVESDGVNSLRYLHSQYGWGTITAVASGVSATMTVTSRLPEDCLPVGGSVRWAKAAFSPTQGWPTDVTFFKNRLVWSKGRNLYMSQVGLYDNFLIFDGPDVTATSAIVIGLTEDRLDNVRWMVQSRDLLLGTAVAEMAIQPQTSQRVFAPDNIQNTPQTQYGSGAVRPLRAGEAVLFVQRSGRRLREMKFEFTIDRYKAEDLNILADHLCEPGIIALDFALEPDNQVWCVLKNGKVGCLTYNRERAVVGWTSVVIGGTSSAGAWGAVENVAVIPKPDGSRDDVWLVVRRTINGATQRHVEVLEDYRACQTGVENSFYVDGGLTYTGSPATTISGLGHLEGETVQVLVDGSTHADRVVSGGSITLDRAGSTVHIGLRFDSILHTMRPELGAQGGTGQSRRRSVTGAAFRLLDTVGAKFGPSLDKLLPVKTLRTAAPIGTPMPLFTGDTDVLPFPANFGTDGYVVFVQDQPLPATLVAIMPRMEVND